MFDWLFEGRQTVYVILAALAAICLFLWQQNRQRHWLIAFAVIGGLCGVYYLLDVLVETDSEQIERRVRALADGVRQHSVQAMLPHVSQTFRPGGHEGFRGLAGRAIDSGLVEEVTVWGFEFPEDGRPADEVRGGAPRLVTEVRVEFMAKPKGSAPFDPRGYFVEATFLREEGQWGLRDFRVFPVEERQKPHAVRTPLRHAGLPE